MQSVMGLSTLWAGLNWANHLAHASLTSYVFHSKSIAWIVSALAIGIGVFSIVSGFRKKDKALCQILGHTRFSCYFLIAFYPMQAGLISWQWTYLAAILVFALPCWFLIYLMGRIVSKWIT